VPGAAPQLTREQELKAAFRKARMSQRAHRVLYVLLYDLAQWNTAMILPERQPKSLATLATKCDMSVRNLKRALLELDELGWVERTPHPGRGLTTTYQLRVGMDAAPKSRTAMTDAERARRYRERKKAGQKTVTDDPSDEPGSGPDSRDASRICGVIRHGAERDDFAGQRGRAAVRDGRDEGEGFGVADETIPMAAERLTVTIAGRKWPALVCLGCGSPVAEVVAFDGCHATCEPGPESERMGA
jgi:DNA-binding HxlR family transcriptional regulator